MDIFHYCDLQRCKVFSFINNKIWFLHKFLSALQIQFHPGLLLSQSILISNVNHYSVHLYLVIMKQWSCDIVFVIVNFNSVCFFLFSSFCLILHSWWIKPYILLMSKTVSLQNNRWQRRSYYSPFGSVPWICHTLLWTGCYVSGCDQKNIKEWLYFIWMQAFISRAHWSTLCLTL